MWTQIEIELLKNKYASSSFLELNKLFPNKSYKSITMKAHRLKLNKSKEVISAHISKRNKLVGRDLSFNVLKDIASRYKTKSEFITKDNSAYTVARVNGWLTKICEHMIPQNYSMPQLILNEIIKKLLCAETKYNDRKAIKPLELDVYVPELNLAFEYDGKFWHKDKNNSTKIKKCKDVGIKLFILIENNKNYENDIKIQLVNISNELEKYLGIKINKSDIMDIFIDYKKLIIDKHDIEEICKKYNSLKIFKVEHYALYCKLRTMKLLDHFTINMKRDLMKPWNDGEALEIINKCESLNQLIKNHSGVYQYCRRNNPELLKTLS